MVEKKAKFNTTKDKFFNQYLNLIKVFPPLNSLREKEIKVLAELLRLNDKYSGLAADLRWKIIFEYSTKVDIKDKLKLSDANFNNILSSLRKKKIIINNTIPEAYLITVDKEFNLNITFNIAD